MSGPITRTGRWSDPVGDRAVIELLTQHGEAILFYAFALAAVVSAVGVISLRNPMYCALSLLVTFLAVAALFLMRHAELLGMVQLFVYGGGIMVLFLFVIMLVNLHRLREVRLFNEQVPIALVLGVLLVALFGWVFLSLPASAPGDSTALVSLDGEVVGNAKAVAWVLYTEYLLPFEIASIFLLVAMIGAVVLGRRD